MVQEREREHRAYSQVNLSSEEQILSDCGDGEET